MRTTLRRAAKRAQSTLSRGTLREADDDHLWQQGKSVDVHHSETHTDVERAQQYGFTCVPMKQDDDEQGQQGQGQGQGQSGSGGGDSEGGGSPGSPEQGKQPKGDAAECIIAYLNGSRSHPVILSIDDRRHRLQKLKPGDVAFYDHQQQQFHLNKDGAFLTSNDDKKIRMQLTKKEESQQQTSQQQQANGAGGGTSGSGSGKQKKKRGQEARYEKGDSKQYHEINPESTDSVNKHHKIMLDDKEIAVEVHSDKQVYLGGLKGKGQFAKVMTESGPAKNVWARIS